MGKTRANGEQLPRTAAAGAAVDTVGVGYHDHKAEQLSRLRKVEGQIRGVSGMVAHDRYCIDVLTQISAATRALQAVAQSLLDDHIRVCVRNAADADPDLRAAQLDELAHTVRSALRL